MFKAGDRVKCISSVGNLSYGPVYTVVRVVKHVGGLFLYVLGNDVNERSGPFLESRFVMAPAPKGDK